MNWLVSLHAFKAIAQNNSFSAGARKLGMTPTKATTLIQQLEKELNTVLFIRTTRRLNLTEEGEELLTRITPILEEWESIYTAFKDKTSILNGTLTIGTVPDLFSVPPFSERLADFFQHYPKVSCVLRTFSYPINLIDESLDIFVGIDTYIRDQGNILSRTLFHFNYSCYASPNYIKQSGCPRKINDLSQHNCIIYSDRNIWSFEKEKIKINGNFYADDGKTLFSAACQGMGIIRVPDFMAKDYVNNKTLIPLLEKEGKERETIKIYYPKMAYQPRKVKEFTAFLIDRVKHFL